MATGWKCQRCFTGKVSLSHFYNFAVTFIDCFASTNKKAMKYSVNWFTMKAKLFFGLTGLLIICSWVIVQSIELNKAAWLIGTWENKTARGSMYETWGKLSDVEFSGKSYVLKERDTIVFETIRLVEEQGSLFYIPVVKKQNEGLPVRFALKTISETALVFENPQHDFPQRIAYTKINADSLVAEISGVKNGQQRRQTFPMKRIK